MHFIPSCLETVLQTRGRHSFSRVRTGSLRSGNLAAGNLVSPGGEGGRPVWGDTSVPGTGMRAPVW